MGRYTGGADNLTEFDAVVVGDLHIPSPVFHADLFLKFLEAVADRTKTLILNGDVFEKLDRTLYLPGHREVLRRLAALSRRLSVVWLVGNHDGPLEVVRRQTGLRFRTQHLMDIGGRRWLVLHGDRFDRTVHHRPRLTAFGNKLYLLVQKLSGRRQVFARWLKRVSKRFSRSRAAVREGCLALAGRYGADGVIAGHTHTVEHHVAPDGTTYLNPGSWTDQGPCFVGISGAEAAVHCVQTWLAGVPAAAR